MPRVLKLTLAIYMEYSHYSEGSVPVALLDRAARAISDYSISLSIDNGSWGSGTLVCFEQYYGILTAAHVVSALERRKDKMIAIVCADHLHRLLLSREHIDIVRLDTLGEESQGPDLAFIAILDQDCVGTLKAKKSFYPIKRTSALTFEEYMPIESRLCFIFGAPAELATETGERGTPEHVLNSIHFAARAQLIGEFSNAGYNFLEFGLYAGEHGFQSKYGGISGGGVWHIPLTMNPDVGLESVDFESPELVGVVFYQRPADLGCVLIAQSYTSFPALFAKYG